MRLTYSLAMLVLSSAAFAANGTFETATQNGRTVTIEFITDDIVRVSNTAQGATPMLTEASVLKPVTEFAGNAYDIPTGSIYVSPTGLTVTVNRADGAVSINAGHDRAISDNGVRTLSDGKQSMSLSTMGKGSFYGAGERGYSYNLAGDSLIIYNKQNYGYTADEERIRQMNICMPLFISSNGYAILFDDFVAATMVMTNPVVYTTEAPAPVSYYFINGAGSLQGVTNRLSALTGRQKLPPFWSLGYITSKYGYKTQAETDSVVTRLKSLGYPLDGIVLDLYWYGKEEDMGRLAWDKEQWPDHKAMLQSLSNKGVHLVPISQPYVLSNGRGVDNYNNLYDKGIFVADSTGSGIQPVKIWVGEGAMFDVSSQATKDWLRERYKSLTDEGVAGWWGDLGEPEVHPETGCHANGLTARQYHNQYGNDWSKIIFDLYNDEYPDTRLMTLMRGGTTGLQRYSVYPWSTDVSRSWGGFKPQINIMLNSGLSGLGYMSHDVGGFAVDEANPTDPELYVRWLQLGTFSPILRTHAQQAAEPFNYPEYETVLRDLIKTRYAWLPYNYTLAWENASQGLPLVRSLDFYTPGSTRNDNISDEYLWGRDVLVAPVMTAGATSREITFPEGQWIDFSDPTKTFAGNTTVNYAAPLEKLPLFVRAGAFIPQANYKMENTGDYRTDRYTVRYFPVEGVASEYTMFEDDRTSNHTLEQNKYALVTFKGNDSKDTITVDISSEGTYPGQPARKDLTLIFENVNKPKAVNAGTRKLQWKYNPATRQLTVSLKWEVANPVQIAVTK